MITETSDNKILETAKSIMEYLKPYSIENPRIFNIYGSMPESVKHEFCMMKIPFLELTDKNKVLVPQAYFQKCIDAENNVKKKAVSFCQEYDGGVLKELIVKHPNIENKKFVQISNMTEPVFSLFLKKCNELKPGLLVETTIKNGLYSVSFPESLLSDKERESIVNAYIESAVSAYGVNITQNLMEDLSKEQYIRTLNEKEFVRLATEAIKEKLQNTGQIQTNFKEYLQSANRQAWYILNQLNNEKIPEGFSEKQKEALLKTFKKLPEKTYDYTEEILKNHKFTMEIPTTSQQKTPVQHKTMSMEQEK